MEAQLENGISSATARWRQQANYSGDVRLRRGLALVVDDDRDTRETLAILLSWAGHDVRVAADGAEALQLAERLRPELLFIDIAMPRINGYEVCRRLRLTAAFEHARIFAVSGISGLEHETRCSEAGFTARLTKPVDPAALTRLG
jgi:CheY-like chemotaxis protein